MDLETAQAFIRNSTVQRYVNQIDADAQAALDEKRVVASMLLMLPSRSLADYHSDAAALERAWDDFIGEWNRIETARASDGRAAMTAYSRYILTLGILERDNVRFGAYANARAFTLWAALARVHVQRTKRVQKLLRRNLAFLRNLHVELRRARREQTEAQIQTVINAALTAVSACITVTSLGLGIGIAVGIFAIQGAADAALGPSGPAIPGTAVNAVTGIGGLPRVMSRPNSRMLGAAGGFLTLTMDYDEVQLARSNIVTIRAMMNRFRQEEPRLMREINAAARDVNAAKQLYEGAVRQARAQARRFRARDGQRRGLLRELSQL